MACSQVFYPDELLFYRVDTDAAKHSAHYITILIPNFSAKADTAILVSSGRHRQVDDSPVQALPHCISCMNHLAHSNFNISVLAPFTDNHPEFPDPKFQYRQPTFSTDVYSNAALSVSRQRGYRSATLIKQCRPAPCAWLNSLLF